MHKISFGGKDYVKASAVAKKFRYTQDYVGQLCRSKKVDARLVGRNWYVDLGSVRTYRKTKHTTQKASQLKPSTTTIVHSKVSAKKNSVRPVAAVLRTKTLKQASNPSSNTFNHVSITYSNDNETLLPVTRSEAKSQKKKINLPKIKVETHPSKKIKVKKNKSKQTNFVSEKLPEITLSGKLKIVDGSNEFTEQDLSEHPELESVSDVRDLNLDNLDVISSAKPNENQRSESLQSEMKVSRKDNDEDVSFVPSTVSEMQKKSPDLTQRTYAPILLSLLSSLVISFLIFFLANEIAVDVKEGVFSNNLVFDLDGNFSF